MASARRPGGGSVVGILNRPSFHDWWLRAWYRLRVRPPESPASIVDVHADARLEIAELGFPMVVGRGLPPFVSTPPDAGENIPWRGY